MPSNSRSCRLFLAFCFLPILSTPSAKAQCSANVAGRGDVAVLPNNPFHAELVDTDPTMSHLLASVKNRKPQSVDRDSQGRVRTELVAAVETNSDTGISSEVRVILICDPVAQTLTIIDAENTTAHVRQARQSTSHMGPASPSPDSFCSVRLSRRPLKGLTMEDLGDQIIEGVEAHGQRLTRLPPDPDEPPDVRPVARTTELWCSDEISAIVLAVSEDPKTGKNVTYAMRDIERTEPDPQLFQIPPNYTITETAGGPPPKTTLNANPASQSQQ
jgi:hypothetical protein